MLIGLDGLDLRIVDRLSAEGRLPTLTALLKTGVSGPLTTVHYSSPVIWTSIATGVAPPRHGVKSFLVNGKPGDATMRLVPAFWNVLTHYGRSVGVLGWWLTFPAEHVNGWIVSPYLTFYGTQRAERVGLLWDGDPRRVYPAELATALRPLAHTASEIAPETLAPYYVDQERTSQTPWAFARDQSYFDMAVLLMDSHPVDVMAVYFQGVDVASHDFSEYVFGDNVNQRREPKVSSEEIAAGMTRIYAMYDRMDTLVHELLERAGDHLDVVIVSDHGWEYDGTSHWNYNPGFFLAAGPSFQRGTRIQKVSVLDVMPLVLAVNDVPLAGDLDGTIPEGVLDPSVAVRVQTVDRYPIPPLMLEPGTKGDAPDDRSLIERLRALGYVP